MGSKRLGYLRDCHKNREGWDGMEVRDRLMREGLFTHTHTHIYIYIYT